MSQRKLLLADDSITIQKVVNLTFADEGIEVITVGDGDSAMEKITEVAPDLVMADVNMPGLNGYQVCEKIRQSETLKKTPVILLVGSFEPFDEAEAKRVGADDFLTKPFQSIRQLVNKVTDLLSTTHNGENGAPAEVHSVVAAGSFEDTQEYEVSHSALQPPMSSRFDDSGIDDEMIQTNQPTGFEFDETPKFETREHVETFEDMAKTQPLSPEELQQISFDHQYEENTAAEVAHSEPVAEYSKPISEEQFYHEPAYQEPIYQESVSNEAAGSDEAPEARHGSRNEEPAHHEFVDEEPAADHEPVYEASPAEIVEAAPVEQESAEQSSAEESSEESSPVYQDATTRKMITPTADMFFDSDDDLLEVPYDDEDEEDLEEEEETPAQATPETAAPEAPTATEPQEAPYQDEAPIQALSADEATATQLDEAAQPVVETVQPTAEFIHQPDEAQVAVQEETGSHQLTASTTEFSPELIEAVAKRVVEMLSDKAVREIAWEVVPQLADLIVRRMAEEKLKE